MKRSSAKRRRASIDPGRRSCPSHSLEALCKRDLVALISELQAQNKAILSIDNSADENNPIEDTGLAAAPVPTPVPCLFIDQPVRSGQNIEFPAGDVTVIGSVSSGAEIVAGGSIHIYGTLRGRALASIAGDCTARISVAVSRPSFWPSMV